MATITNKGTEIYANGIGGGDVASILGLNPYATPYQTWEAKIKGSQWEDNEKTIAGRLLEPVILKWFQEETGKQVFSVPVEKGKVISPINPWRLVKPDSLVDESGLIEVKNARYLIEPDDIIEGRNISWFFQTQWGLGVWNETFPANYRDKGYIAWLSEGWKFQYLEVPFDEELYEEVCEQVDHFWNYNILEETPPNPISKADIMALYQKVLPKSKDGTEFAEIVAELARLKKVEKEAKRDIDSLALEIQLYLLDHDTLIIDGKPALTWKEQSTTRFDQSKFQEDHPTIFERYKKVTKSRVLRLKI